MRWIHPTPTSIAATLGAKPGNTMRPPANEYQLYQYVAKDQCTIPNIPTPAGYVEELPPYKEVQKEPEVIEIAGVKLDELTKGNTM
jgi:hypothetical protein